MNEIYTPPKTDIEVIQESVAKLGANSSKGAAGVLRAKEDVDNVFGWPSEVWIRQYEGVDKHLTHTMSITPLGASGLPTGNGLHIDFDIDSGHSPKERWTDPDGVKTNYSTSEAISLTDADERIGHVAQVLQSLDSLKETKTMEISRNSVLVDQAVLFLEDAEWVQGWGHKKQRFSRFALQSALRRSDDAAPVRYRSPEVVFSNDATVANPDHGPESLVRYRKQCGLHRVAVKVVESEDWQGEVTLRELYEAEVDENGQLRAVENALPVYELIAQPFDERGATTDTRERFLFNDFGTFIAPPELDQDHDTITEDQLYERMAERYLNESNLTVR